MPLRRDSLAARKAEKEKPKLISVAAEDRDLWETRRDCRKRLADENNVPPYVIFHDTTLMQMAADEPQSSEALLAISGVGQTKLERYGPEFLEDVRLC